MDYIVHGVAELDATERLSLSLFNDKQVVHFMHNHARSHTHTHVDYSEVIQSGSSLSVVA